MVVPYSDPEYYRVRPSIAIPGSDVIPLTDHTGLHPNLAPFESLYGDGVMQVLHGVGYDQPCSFTLYLHRCVDDRWRAPTTSVLVVG